MSRSEIIKRKLISRSKLEKAIKEGVITEVKIGNVSYFDRIELSKLI